MPRKTKNVKPKTSPERRFVPSGTATSSTTQASTRQYSKSTSPAQAPRWLRCIPHAPPFADTDDGLSHRVEDDHNPNLDPTRDDRREDITSARRDGTPDAQDARMADHAQVCLRERITGARCDGNDDKRRGVVPSLTASSSDVGIGVDFEQTCRKAEVTLAECEDIMQEQQWKWENLTRNVSELPRDFRNDAGRRLCCFDHFAGDARLFKILLSFLPEEDVLKLQRLNLLVESSAADVWQRSKGFDSNRAPSHFKANSAPSLSAQWAPCSNVGQPKYADDESLLDGNTVMTSPRSSSSPHSASRTPNSAFLSEDASLTVSTPTTTTPTQAVATPSNAASAPMLFPVMQLPSLIGLSSAHENTWREFNFFPYPMVTNGHIPENEEIHVGARSNADERCERSQTLADRTADEICEENVEEEDEACEHCQFSETRPQTALSKPPDTYPRRITAEFHVCTFLGAGAFASVHLLRSKREKPPRYMALKIVEKQPLQERNLVKQIIREFSLQSRATAKGCGSSNIVHMAAFFSDDTHCYAMLEYMCNGDLPTLLAKYRNFQVPERTAGFIFGQVLEGVHFIHSLHIVHRDLKPDNIMFDEKWMVKIGDFGWAADWSSPGDERKTTCGTMEYMAPEILQHALQIYGAVDLWTCGILLYEMIAGHNPFSSSRNSLEEFREAVMNLRYAIPAHMSIAPRDLVRRMLQVNPCYRMTASLALKQAWIDETYLGPLLRKEIPSMLPEEPQCVIMPQAACAPAKLQVNVPVVQQHAPVLFSPCGALDIGPIPTTSHTILGRGGSPHFKAFPSENTMINAKVMTKSLSRPELSSAHVGSSSARECHVPRPMPSRRICLSPPLCHDRDWQLIRPMGNYQQPYDIEKAKANFRMPFPLQSPRTPHNPTSPALPFRPAGTTQAQGLQAPGLQFRPVLQPQPLRDVTPFGLQRDRSNPIDRQSPLARLHSQRVDRIHAMHRPIGYATPLPTKS